METAEEIKKDYEIAYLVPTEEANKNVVGVITKHGGEVKSEGSLRPLHLAYKIEKISQAYFGYMQFRSTPAQVKELEQGLRNKSVVLRSMIITLPAAGSKAAEAASAPRSVRPTTARPAVAEKKPVPPPSLSNEALEKKIEEILQ